MIPINPAHAANDRAPTTSRERHEADERNDHPYSFIALDRERREPAAT